MRRASIIAAIALVAVAADLAAQDLETIADEPALEVGGSVSASITGHSSHGIARTQPDVAWSITGGVTPRLYGVDLPMSFTVSNQESSFRQPFNEFGMSPSYGPVTAHLGFRSMTFSPYTLAGVTFLGAGLEGSIGPVRLAAMYGRLQRAVDEDTTQLLVIPAYERTGWGAMIGFGSGDTKVDLSLLHAIDDSSSLRQTPLRGDILPAENTALGLSMKIGVAPGVRFDADAGASLLTRDVRSGPAPIDDEEIPSFLTSIQEVRASTSLAFATRAGLDFTFDDFSLRLGYERIEPGYQSLGAYYMATDLENWTISPQLHLLDRALMLSGSIGIGRDNLLDTKEQQTDRLIGSAAVNWIASDRFALDAQYSNYATGQSAGRVVGNDSIRARTVNRAGSISPRLTLQDESMQHAISLLVGMQSYEDLSAFSSSTTSTESYTTSINYLMTHLESKLSLGGSILANVASTTLGNATTVGVNANGGMTLFEDRLSLGANLSFSRVGMGSGLVASTVLGEGVNAGWNVSDDDSFTLDLSATQSSGGTVFDEVQGSFGYRRSF